MLIENDHAVPWYWTMATKVFVWLLLAGFIVFPSTFTSLSRSEALNHTLEGSEPVSEALRNPPLLAIALLLFVVSTAAPGYIWWIWKGNYIWALNRIILPLLANSSLGLITTLLNISTAQDGNWSATAITSTAITSFCLFISMIGYAVYDLWLLRPLRNWQEDPKPPMNVRLNKSLTELLHTAEIVGVEWNEELADALASFLDTGAENIATTAMRSRQSFSASTRKPGGVPEFHSIVGGLNASYASRNCQSIDSFVVSSSYLSLFDNYI
ncbi:uncharacterized protein JN550_012831 [Neoarthrinium moseri]|uniref:uncharacterized protein n=1 Tax=Neoarthrinium moseri TaxID=1658444 RepID=UPI001FDB6169|nr:uncharacterized protein JN550_012831 [Neoarthrinium moseri]KAI1858300.1 hypothetical protein JN550_012831 [Neoarthrinium moseri]